MEFARLWLNEEWYVEGSKTGPSPVRLPLVSSPIDPDEITIVETVRSMATKDPRAHARVLFQQGSFLLPIHRRPS
jgi:hypothetical protein